MSDTDDIPEWAIQAADDFHGAQEVDLELARTISRVFTASFLNLTKAEREATIIALTSKSPTCPG